MIDLSRLCRLVCPRDDSNAIKGAGNVVPASGEFCCEVLAALSWQAEFTLQLPAAQQSAPIINTSQIALA